MVLELINIYRNIYKYICKCISITTKDVSLHLTLDSLLAWVRKPRSQKNEKNLISREAEKQEGWNKCFEI